jgi:hypothetical protein
VIAAAVLGETGLWDLEDGKNVRLRIPAATKAHRLRVLIWSGVAADVKGFAKAVATVQSGDEAPNLIKLTQGGKAQWTETVETQIQTGLDLGPYATDTFQLPDNNPWKSWMRLGGSISSKTTAALRCARGRGMCGSLKDWIFRRASSPGAALPRGCSSRWG